MSILGFSHISTESKDAERSLAFYKNNLGYELFYALEQKVPPAKQTILDSHPEDTRLLYLRQLSRPSIGIELITHSRSSHQQEGPGMAYGWVDSKAPSNMYIDPDGNKLLCLGDLPLECKQHVFIPVRDVEISKEFFKAKFHFKETAMTNFPSEIYQNLYGNIAAWAVLGMGSCLSPNWNASLHLVEVKDLPHQRFLNDCRFSCICLLIDEAQFLEFQESQLPLIGPFEMEKEVQRKKSIFTIGFIQSPDGFLVEFYIPSRLAYESKTR